MPNKNAELFVVVGCEELPARLIEPALSQLKKNVLGLLKNIKHGEVQTWSTPRRIAVAVSDLESHSPLEEKLVTGPPADRAFKDGEPTKAAIGFARGKGVPVEDLQIVDGPRGKVVGVNLRTGGESVIERIQKGLEQAILGIEFDRSMRWGSQKTRWARPLHRIIALYDEKVIPCTVGSLKTSNIDLGHRLSDPELTVNSAQEWVDGLEAKWVIADSEKRHAICEEQLKHLASEYDATIRDWDLLEEVNNLVEWPVSIACHFPEELLELPPRLLVEAMKLHQRVFPLYDKDGELLSTFLTVTNHPFAIDPEVAKIIAEGNKRVLTARFYDAKFFYAEDRKKPLLEHGQKLQTMRWVRKGGTVADKVQRLVGLAETWAPKFGANAQQTTRAALLSKCDLATQMVYEFPKLQGHVGNLMAQYEGEDKKVSQAIEEHYLPRYAGDSVPETKEGLTLAFIDRLDTLQETFRLGLQPKGSGDPLGLRRASNGIISLLLKAEWNVSLNDVFSDPALVKFVTARMKAQFHDEFGGDCISAVFSCNSSDPVGIYHRCQALKKLSTSVSFPETRSTFKRLMGLSKDHKSTDYDSSSFVDDSERALHTHFQEISAIILPLEGRNEYSAVLEELIKLKPSIDHLFDSVMVMDSDLDVRHNRLGLLRSISTRFLNIADFTFIN